METIQTLSKEANPRAISIRIEPRSPGRATGQRRHDLRLGQQPGYVDATRKHLNDIVISPLPAPELRQVCMDRRSMRETKRALKSNAAIATCGIITLGIEAQIKFAALDHSVQIAAMTAVADAIARRLKTTLTGLVIHRDETAIHAHFQMPAVNFDGHPITQANSLSDISRLQDLAADTICRFEPSIERGNKKRDRLAAGASSSEVTHRTVRELHWDLPIEFARKQKRVAEMEMRVSELEAKNERTEAENKRLQI